MVFAESSGSKEEKAVFDIIPVLLVFLEDLQTIPPGLVLA
jgi:hypothetical protein